MSMFSERKDNAYVCRIGWPCWCVTLVAQRATEVTDIPGVPRQPGWVRPEGGAPGERRASGYEPSERSAAAPDYRARCGWYRWLAPAPRRFPVSTLMASMTRQPSCGCPPADPGDDDGSI